MDEPTDSSISLALESLTLNPTSTHISTLATASRSQPLVRQKLADLNVLRTLIDLVEISLNETLETTCLALRCIGNACIDNDLAREYFAADLGFGWAIQCLHFSVNGGDASVGLLAMKVLYNIASDHEGAQKKMYEARVHYALWKMQRVVAQSQQDLSLYAELLLWITSHKAELEPGLKEAASMETILAAISLPSDLQNDVEDDDFAMLVEAALSLLRDSSTQKQILESKKLEAVFSLVSAIDKKLTAAEDPEQVKILAGCWTSLLWCLSDVAANPAMVQIYSLESMEVQGLVAVLQAYVEETQTNARLPTAACQVIGNVLWNLQPQDYLAFVERRWDGGTTLHASILQALVDKDDVEFMHAATGLLVLISRASIEHRERMGADCNASGALDKLCHHEKAELKADGAQLLKALGRDCPANQFRYADLAVEVQAQMVSPTPG